MQSYIVNPPLISLTTARAQNKSEEKSQYQQFVSPIPFTNEEIMKGSYSDSFSTNYFQSYFREQFSGWNQSFPKSRGNKYRRIGVPTKSLRNSINGSYPFDDVKLLNFLRSIKQCRIYNHKINTILGTLSICMLLVPKEAYNSSGSWILETVASQDITQVSSYWNIYVVRRLLGFRSD